MKKKKWPLLLFFAILAAGILGSVMILRQPRSRQVEILRDGEILYSIDLDLAEDQILVIEYGGSNNTVEIRDHRIHMKEAECPDQTCVEMGWLESGMPIVCLPNHLIIRFAEQDGGVDSVVG